MKLTKYVSANILSLFGIIGMFSLLYYTFLSYLVYPNYLLEGFAFDLFGICINTYIYLIPIIIFLLILEIQFNKKYTLNIQCNNKYLINTYNILFWLGIVCSVLYLLLYLWL